MESSTCGWNFTLRDLNQDYGALFIQNQRRYNTSQWDKKTIVLVSCKNSVDKYITNCFFCLTESWDWKVWIPVYFCRDWHVSQEDSRHWRQQIQWVLSVKHILGISMVDINLKALNGNWRTWIYVATRINQAWICHAWILLCWSSQDNLDSGSGRSRYLERTVLVLKHLVFCTRICMIVLYNMWFEIKIND